MAAIGTKAAYGSNDFELIPKLAGSYQGSEMVTHQALEMLKRCTGLTKAQ
jgi:hypothetical protein